MLTVSLGHAHARPARASAIMFEYRFDTFFIEIKITLASALFHLSWFKAIFVVKNWNVVIKTSKDAGLQVPLTNQMSPIENAKKMVDGAPKS